MVRRVRGAGAPCLEFLHFTRSRPVARATFIYRKIKKSFLMRRGWVRRYLCRGHAVLFVGTGGGVKSLRYDA